MIAERSTAVFTGLLSPKKSADYPYLIMDEDPLGSGSYKLRRDRPPYEKLGREISFENLPEGCRQLVLDTYRELWNL